MSHPSDAERERMRESLVGTVLLLLFGCGVLMFLVAIDHANWFSIRPASGTGLAMAGSATRPDQQEPVAIGDEASKTVREGATLSR